MHPYTSSLRKQAQQYAALRKPYLINDILESNTLLDRRSVYRRLQVPAKPYFQLVAQNPKALHLQACHTGGTLHIALAWQLVHVRLPSAVLGVVPCPQQCRFTLRLNGYCKQVIGTEVAAWQLRHSRRQPCQSYRVIQ